MKWTAIRTISSVKFLSVSYGVLATIPFVANVAKWLDVRLPWTLLWLFFSALFAFLATVVYNLKCPEDIRNSKNRENYVNVRRPLEENAPQDEKANVIGTLSDNESLKKELAELVRAKASGKATDDQKARYSEIVADYFSPLVQRYVGNKWDILNRSSPAARTLATIFLVIAASIVLGVWSYRIYVVVTVTKAHT